jgi:DNA-binding response OmpR family regulator
VARENQFSLATHFIMAKTILTIDDEPDIVKLIEYNLQQAGFKTICAYDGVSAHEQAKKHLPDLIILDLMLPKLDGFEVCKLLKRDEETANIPILMLTAREEKIDRILGFELGADDYFVKSAFSPRELVLRVKAILRRSEPQKREDENIIKVEYLTINLEKHQAFLNGQPIDLTVTEFSMLAYLARRRGRIYTRQNLMTEVWGQDYYGLDRTVDTHISRLRQKLGDMGDYIQTVYGVGYRFKE